MSHKDSGKVDFARLAIAVFGVIWIMVVLGNIWESCTLF